MALFSGQGIVTIAKLDSNGVPGSFRDVGNVPDFSVGLKETLKQHKESRTGTRAIDFQLTTEQAIEVKATLEEFQSENLKLAVRASTVTSHNSGTVSGTAATSPTGMVAGDSFTIPDVVNITAATVKDSAGSPVTLVEGEDYTIDKGFGTITIIDPTGFTQPFLVTGVTHGASKEVAMFTAAKASYCIRFNGVNTADGNKKVLVELYSVQLSPAATLSFISDDYGKFELSGAVQVDNTKAADGALGQFGRIIELS